ncbi:unnamed protein product (macronuclear) [Paramecium tetraurelia]|uniref:RING-type E3 ubiquitin transferase n=1 Tax=Paramecium tetraurelia TaxID=5888 RepID=A0BCN3_PARTE|nr:uncharacterized protein GSPATT00004394001 [Paramecium tetraurelia]CAK56300.1 unnamed protein product [Paramecium tetraurelia]|eukprot:XP_001423698.1 hypothetical protein (macronuclear) [Paramecium tetraurelia strain d4-2]
MQNSITLCWCHICKKQFESQVTSDLIKCAFCQQEFCEVIDPQNDPRGFIPYGENQQQRQSQTQLIQQQQPQTIIHITRNQIPIRFQQRTNLFDNLLQLMFPNTQFQPGQSLEQLIDFISQNDPNRYGSPPASQIAIDSLQKINLQSECCTVCQEEYQTQEAVQMPCQHHFHSDCLIPWLKQHNSCPVCRFELITDDDDYNKRKNLK